MTLQTHNRLVFLVIRNHQGDVWMFKANKSGVQSSFMRDHCLRCQKRRRVLGSYLCLCSSCPPCPCMTICPEACFPSLGESIWGISTSSKPRSKRLCLELSGRKKKAPKHKVMKALRMRSKMNFSESLNVALWCGKEEAPGDRVGILRPESGRRAGVVMLWLLQWTSLGEELAGRGGVGWVYKCRICCSSNMHKLIVCIISSLHWQVQKQKRAEVPQQRSDWSAGKRSWSFWKKKKKNKIIRRELARLQNVKWQQSQEETLSLSEICHQKTFSSFTQITLQEELILLMLFLWQHATNAH